MPPVSRLLLLGVMLLPFFGALAAAAAPPASPVVGRELKEIWETAALEGVHAGHVHRQFREIKFGERTVVEGVVEMDLEMCRFGQPVRLQSTQATHENPLGKLRAFVLTEGVGAQRLNRRGKVTGTELVWTVQMGTKAPAERRLPWTETALGLYAQEQLLPQRPAGETATFSYERFEPVYDTIVTVEVTLGDWEEIQLPGSVRKRLRKVTSRLDPKTAQDAPPEFMWVDEAGEAWKRQVRLPLLGELVTYRSTKELATGRRDAAALDIGRSQLAPVARALTRPNDLKAATYRIKLAGVDDAANAFPVDDRQSVRLAEPNVVEIRVEETRPTPHRQSQPLLQPNPPAEFLRNNAFLNSDDAEVRRLARLAVGAETDLWRKALKIERWVRQNMRGYGATEGFAAAAEVARSRTGDCKGHAVLAAAMCRAAGVPSRIVVGLVYVPREKAFGFHMWLEAWADGQWFALDPTVGQGRVGADHIKVLDHHLNGEASFAPMLPVARLLGRMQIEVVAAEPGLR